jgi:dienelactone hydrolase
MSSRADRRAIAGRGILACVIVLVCCRPAFAAGRPVTLHAEDGRTVSATIFDANRQPAPAVVLVPALGHSRDEWQAVAQRLADQNITALSIDLPGSSAPDPKELAGWATVIRAAVTFLAGQPTVRPSAIAVAGAAVGASLAAIEAGTDPRVVALALVSPSEDYRGLRIESALRQFGARPVVFIASRRDPYAARSARELSKDANGPRETFLGDSASHGVPLLAAEPDLARMLVDWFQRMLGVG